jgi:hypothetical protein
VVGVLGVIVLVAVGGVDVAAIGVLGKVGLGRGSLLRVFFVCVVGGCMVS